MIRPRFRMPSPAMVVALLALAVAMSGTAYSATGGNFILGQSNSASHVTALKNSRGAAMALTSGGKGTPLSLTAPAGVAPLAVNSPTRVANLNADLLDGLSAADLQPTAASTGNFTGPLPQTLPDWNFSGQVALVIVTGSAYRASAGDMELGVFACPGNVASCGPLTTGNIGLGTRDLFTNEANSHKPMDMTLAVDLTPGTYSLGVSEAGVTETDASDSFSVTAVNLG